MQNVFNTKKTKNYWVEILLGAFCIVAAVIFAPIIVAYLVGYLWKKAVSSNGIVKVLTIIEFVALSIIALGCIFTQFDVIPIQGACKIFGLVLWCRGVVELLRAFYLSRVTTYKYSSAWFFVAVAMVSFGVYCFAKPFIQDTAILWLFVLMLFALGILFVIIGCMQKPVRAKVKDVK